MKGSTGFYRPVDVLVREHPLRAMKEELQSHGYCAELPLDFPGEEDAAEYLRRQFPLVPTSQAGEYPSRDRQGAERQTEAETERKKDRPLAHARGSEEGAALRGLARVIHRRTDGNPLFMVNVVDSLVARGVLVQSDGGGSRGRDYRWAVQYLQQAGENAVRHSANAEAVSHFTNALELLKTLPDTPERTQQELRLQITLGTPLAATKGWAAPEVGTVYTRAQELCQQVGETPQLFPVLQGLWGFYLMRVELQTAWELGEQFLTLVQNVQGPELLLQAYYALGVTLLPLGEVVSARAHLEQSLAFYDPQKSRSYTLRTIISRVTGLTTEALALWLLGYPDQALQRDHEALTSAQELAHPHSVASALVGVGWLHKFRREGQAAQARAEAAIALSTEQGFAQLLALGTIQRGWALNEQGQGEEGIVQVRQGLAACRATGAELYRSGHLALLAEAHGKAGQPEEGLAVLAEALDTVNKSGERYYEAELYRLKGELRLQKFQVSGSKFQVQESPKSEVRSPESEAEECFWKAIDIARKQQAKSWELRAVMSLSRLRQQQGKREETRRMLAEIYGWFTEGFDTKDLQEAKALLEELEGKSSDAPTQAARTSWNREKEN